MMRAACVQLLDHSRWPSPPPSGSPPAASAKKDLASPRTTPTTNGAVLFATHCSGCHTLSAAGTQGSGNRGERTQGPNLNQRTETYEDALFAIQNGGFSGAIMPQNIVVGKEAEAVARFVAKYAGDEAEESPRPAGETDSP